MSNTVSFFRRRFPRRSMTRAIGVLIGGEYSPCRGIEIGEGGLAFEAQKQLALDTEIVVSFYLPNGNFFSQRAAIKNCEKSAEGYSIGCSFSRLKVEQKREIRGYVAGRKN